MQVVRRAHGHGRRIDCDEVALVDVRAVGRKRGLTRAEIDGQVILRIAGGLDRQHLGAQGLAVDFIARGQILGQGRLLILEAGVVVQDRGGLDDRVGGVVHVQLQFLERAQHAIGHLAAQLALGDLDAAGQGGLVLGDRDQIADVDVPRAGADLGDLVAHVDLADPHMVGIGVADHFIDAADHDVFDLLAEVADLLDLGAGHGHPRVILLGRDAGNIGIIRKPGKRQFHNK